MDFVLIIVIALNVIISYQGFNDYNFFKKYQFHVGSIRTGEQFRMISSAFLHADWAHLVFNMVSLYFFAPVIIQNFGAFSFILFYVISLLAGNLLTFYYHKNDFHYTAIGASGAVTGIVFSAIIIYPEMNLYLFFIPLPIPAYLFGFAYLFYSIYGIKAKFDNIGHIAHFGGAIGGYFITLAKAPELFFANLKYVVLLAIPIFVLLILIKNKKI